MQQKQKKCIAAKLSAMLSSPHPSIPRLALALLLAAGGCQTAPDPAPATAEPAALIRINTAVNQQGRPCSGDTCLDDWPGVADIRGLIDRVYALPYGNETKEMILCKNAERLLGLVG